MFKCLTEKLQEKRWTFFVAFIAFSLSVPSPVLSKSFRHDGKSVKAPSAAEMKWGIRIVSLKPAAAGYMLDLRFRVLDSAKASHILSRKSKAFIIDQSSGKALSVPVGKTGPMRQTTLKPKADRVYFALFSNPGGLVKQGSAVTVVIGDFRVENVVIQSSGERPVKKSKPQVNDLNESKNQRRGSVTKGAAL